MKHFASPDFWECYQQLPTETQKLADKNFELLKADPSHPSLHLKKAANYWSLRVGLQYRCLGVENPRGILWFWIGPHTDYDRILRKTD